MSGSPRPSFDQPTHIPYEQVTRHVWGDETSGEVIDWIYVSSSKIHQLVFSMPFAGHFRHSDKHRTIFAADELYYVISGTAIMRRQHVCCRSTEGVEREVTRVAKLQRR